MISSLPPTNRQIRVFISSTFMDMQEDRNYLVRHIFPQLRKLCYSRCIDWTEVDLRWGITGITEQNAEAKVLPVCLDEIKRCRPYFICLLGERYGWIPKEFPADLVEREKWLKNYKDSKVSVTELEILHGVLNNKEIAKQAFFYFRDPNYVSKFSGEELKNFVDENNTESKAKISELKDRIRKSGLPVHENYKKLEELGNHVLEDFKKVINDSWPEGSQPDPLDREAIDHEAYAHSRKHLYIARPQEYYQKLTDYADSDENRPLVVLGESGSGKSALLANWVAHYQAEPKENHLKALVLQHYIGATLNTNNLAGMLRRLIRECNRQLKLQQDIPSHPELLRNAFFGCLSIANASILRSNENNDQKQGGGYKKIIIVLDALNQLEDCEGVSDFVRLLSDLPKNVRIITSTLPGRLLNEIKERAWIEFNVKPLSVEERKVLAIDLLKKNGKELEDQHIERIAKAQSSANPLFLRVLMDELCIIGDPNKLVKNIDCYLKATSPSELFEIVIGRWEKDYGIEFVGKSLSFLWAARNWLSESEWKDLLGNGETSIACIDWNPFLAVLNPHLIINRGYGINNGCYAFSHEFLRKAIEKKYFVDDAKKKAVHLQIADYYEKHQYQKSLGMTERRTTELAYQLYKSENLERLKAHLADINVFDLLYSKNTKLDYFYYCALLNKNNLDCYSALRISYNRSIDRWGYKEDIEICCRLGEFYSEGGKYDDAQRFMNQAIDECKKEYGEESHRTKDAINDLTKILLNKLDKYPYERDTDIEADKQEALRLSFSIFSGLSSNVDADEPELNDADKKNFSGRHQFRSDREVELIMLINEIEKGMMNAGRVFLICEMREDAINIFRELLGQLKSRLGDNNIRTQECLFMLAKSLQNDEGTRSEAKELLLKSLKLSKYFFGPEHPKTIEILKHLAIISQEEKNNK